jgi:hypothetical protein
MEQQERKPMKILVPVMALGVLAAGIGITLWCISAEHHRQAQQTFCAWERARFLSMLKTHLFVFGSLPEGWDQFETSGAYILSTEEMNGFWAAFPGKGVNTDMKALQAEILQEALADARPQLAVWNNELAAARKPLEDLKGNLRGQLDLFFDPKFDVRVTTHFVDDLERQKGVTSTAVNDFLNSSRLLRDADHFMNHPVGPIDDARLNAVLKLRAEEQYQKSRGDLERNRDEILRQVGEHATSP